ncbi:MAG: hypothetical protein OHK0056_26710 [Bacteriovoracaceae bacterium]
MNASSFLAQYSGEEILTQSILLGSYLVSMSIAGLIFEKVSRHRSKSNLFLVCEILNAFSGGFFILLFCLSISLYLLYVNPFVFSPIEIPLQILFIVSIPIVFILGFFSGLQLPLLLKLNNDHQSEIISLNYVGALVAGIFLNRFIATNMSWEMMVLFPLLISFATVLLFISFQHFMSIFTALLILISFMFINVKYLERSIKFEKLVYYLGLKLDRNNSFINQFQNINNFGKVESYRSRYQQIDLVSERPQADQIFLGNFTMFLNRRPQFDLYTYKIYHDSMISGALNLSQVTVKNVLVLGAGDGGLVNELLKNKSVQSVTLVEIDETIIEISKTHEILSRLNNFIFSRNDERLKIFVTNAISFLRESNNKFDAIFVDFPYPYSDQIRQLYSREFYRLIERNLSDIGFVIVDFPLEDSVNGQRLSTCFVNSMKASGFRSFFAFGPYANFVFAEKTLRSIGFDFSKFDENLSVATALNMLQINIDLNSNQECVFSIFGKNKI